jgi:hypothetical protein
MIAATENLIVKNKEPTITLNEARKHLPGREGRASLAQCYRWATTGCRGIRLEVVAVGNFFTSIAACQRFVAATTQAAVGKQQAPPPGIREQRRRSSVASRELHRAGILTEKPKTKRRRP